MEKTDTLEVKELLKKAKECAKLAMIQESEGNYLSAHNSYQEASKYLTQYLASNNNKNVDILQLALANYNKKIMELASKK